MSNVLISDPTIVATTANLTDVVPVYQVGVNLPRTITAQQIVDLAEENIAVMSGGMKSFFFTKTASDVAGMYKAINIMPTGGVQTIATVIGDNETVLASFIEDIHPVPYRVVDGSRFFHQQAMVSSTARPVQLKGYVYLCDVNGLNPTLLRTSTLSAALTTVNSEVTMSVWGGSLEIPITQRAKFVIAAVKTGAGTSPTVTLSIDDDTFSRLDVPTAVETLATVADPFASLGIYVGTTQPAGMVAYGAWLAARTGYWAFWEIPADPNATATVTPAASIGSSVTLTATYTPAGVTADVTPAASIGSSVMLTASYSAESEIITGAFTNNTTSPQGFTAGASSEYSQDAGAWRAFSLVTNNASDAWTTPVDPTYPQYIEILFGSSKNVTGYTVFPQVTVAATRSPLSWTIVNEAGTTVATETNITGWADNVGKQFTVPGGASMSKFKMIISANNGATYLSIAELKIQGVN